MARSIEGQPLFYDAADRRMLLELFGAVTVARSWKCFTYCLMTTHYHFLVQITNPNLSVGMQRLNGEYGRLFNRRYGTKGHRFHRRFAARHVTSDGHLLEASRYVVLNPVRARVVDDPADWPWSSYAATIGRAPRPAWLDVNWLLECFGSDHSRAIAQYTRFVEEALAA